MNIIFSHSATYYGLLQQGYAILYDSVLLQKFILHVLVYIMQFAWFLFYFLWVRVCIPLHISNTGCNVLWSAPASFNVGKGKRSLLRRPPAQSLYTYFFLGENAVKLFSCHVHFIAHFISEASNCCCGDKPEQPHQELSHGTRGAKAGRMKLSSFA